MNSTALILAYIGVVFMVGLAGIASAIGTSICGQTAVGAMKKNSGASRFTGFVRFRMFLYGSGPFDC